MIFSSRMDFLLYLKSLSELSFGSEGVTYYDRNTGKVIKVFHSFFEEQAPCYCDYKKEELIKFAGFLNDTYIFSEDILIVDGKVAGYFSRFVQGKCLYELNPLRISLDKFMHATELALSDVELVSKKGILTYDVMYNIMYGNGKIHVVDTNEYCQTDMEEKELNKINAYNLNIGIQYFLIDNYLDEFINRHKLLEEMYGSKETDILEFLKLLKKEISESLGFEVEYLKQAHLLFNKQKKKEKFIRII